MKDDVKKIMKKAKVIVKVCKIAATAATVAMAVYTLLPKYEKIEGLNTDALVSNKEVV